MANFSEKGCRLSHRLTGGTPIVETMQMSASDGTATFLGDLLQIDAYGSAGLKRKGMIAVAQAGSTGAVIGVAQSFEQYDEVSNSNFSMFRRHRPASVAMYVHVVTDTMAVFSLQSSASVAEADVGLNADLVVGTGSTVTGISGNELGATLDTTATRMLRVLGFVDTPTNEVAAANNKVLVKINNHSYGSHTGTVGE